MPARRKSPRLTVIVVSMIAMFMAIMDTTIVNVALPTISRDLSVPLNRVDGVVVNILVTAASWRWVFYVNVPIGVAGFIFGAVFLPEQREPGAGRFDLPGFALACAAARVL